MTPLSDGVDGRKVICCARQLSRGERAINDTILTDFPEADSSSRTLTLGADGNTLPLHNRGRMMRAARLTALMPAFHSIKRYKADALIDKASERIRFRLIWKYIIAKSPIFRF